MLGTISLDLLAEVNTSSSETKCKSKTGDQVWIEGGTFTMGDNETYREEAPEHKVTIDSFWIDTNEVTNAQFKKFIDETGYVTVAERKPNPEDIPGAPPEMLKPGSVVFTPPFDVGGMQNITQWWTYMPGANWRHPSGPKSNIDGKDNLPVVHIAFEDAQAYADWAGRELPTEAQFEFVARSQKEGEHYAWGGEELAPERKHMANTWQGIFPLQDTKEDGYAGIAPVGCYDPNEYGAYDLIGNVWEWTSNWYADRHNPNDTLNPKGPTKEDSFDEKNAGFPVRVVKGGSYLCAPSFCMRYRPAARQAQDTGLGSDHIGFRTVSNQR
ncbi:formylglycine-generating enzyme family protein [Sneathiella sp.]|uniref:formylglycine-generating enzyme family protein n=1 Tax=Sneathiella sp. TaxID=1964365 RepID=UPI0039E46F94